MTKAILRVAIVVTAVLAMSGQAQARTTIVEPAESHFPYQEWVDEARVPTPNLSVAVIETSYATGCPSSAQYATACVVYADPITVYISPEGAARVKPRKILYHELGHVVDHFLLQEWMRVRFMVMLGLSGAWRPAPEDSSTPSELLAETWSQCAIRPYLPMRNVPAGGGWDDSGLIGQEDPLGGRRTHNRLCRMLARL